MAAAPVSEEEEDIWNYTSSVSKSYKKKKTLDKAKPVLVCSAGLKESNNDSNVSSCTGAQMSNVIHIDSDEDFSFTSTRPVDSKKSAAQWASLFVAKAKGNNSINECQPKKVMRKNKRKLIPSRSPLKTKTNYTSPKKTYPKKIKVLDSNEKEMNSSEEIDGLYPQSNAKNISDGVIPVSSFSACQLSPDVELNSIKSKSKLDSSSGGSLCEQGNLVMLRDDGLKPQIMNVIVVEDESDASVVTNKAFCINAFTDSDSDKDEVGLESEGGFLRDQFLSKPKGPICEPLPNRDEKPTTASSVNPPDSEGKSNCDVSSAPSTLLPTAARKQMSIASFFSAKASVSTSKPKIESTSKGIPLPTLAKSLTLPLQGASSQWVGSGSNSTTSSTTVATYGHKQYRGRQQRQCPFYKKIPNTGFTVDAFRYGDIPSCKAYFLTHFHYDHYGGLTKKFSQPIYCSEITGNLVEKRLGVNEKWIHRLPMWKRITVEGVTLTLMEANHCPGAVIVLFETQCGKKILHTGDFRASIEMEAYPALKNIVVDELYLDTTYCDPSYAFPSQKTVIDFAVSLVDKQMKINPKTLVVCGAYTIGKERIFTAIAKALDSKICVMSDKKKVLDCLDDEDLKKRVTLTWSEGRVHVLPMAKLRQEPLFEHHTRHSQYTSILAFEPTGWTHSNKPINLDSIQPKWSKNAVTLYGVPYSEHSSYMEMKRFVQFTHPKKILPTVNNGNQAARTKMEKIFAEWLSE